VSAVCAQEVKCICTACVSAVCAQEVKNQHHLDFRRTYGLLDRKPRNTTLQTFRQSAELNTADRQREIIRKFCEVIAIFVLLYGFEPWTLNNKRQ